MTIEQVISVSCLLEGVQRPVVVLKEFLARNYAARAYLISNRSNARVVEIELTGRSVLLASL